MIRVTDAQKEVLKEAAEADGLDLSSWMRTVALQKAATKKTTAE